MPRGMDAKQPDDPRDDQQLVAAINRGDRDAFDALYQRYRDWVYHLALRFAANHDGALDVAQETFIYLLRKFPGFELRAKMTTFLYPVVRHIAIDAQKRARRITVSDQAVQDGDTRGDDSTNPVAILTNPTGDRARDALARVLASLPETHREVILLRFVDDLSLAEISDAMEIPVGTVKSRMHNALNALRKDENTRRYFDQP